MEPRRRPRWQLQELQVLVWRGLQVLLLDPQELLLALLEEVSLPEEACSSLALAAGLQN